MRNAGTYHGSCLCGAVQYEVDQLEPRMAQCHCRMCRKFHGAAHSTYGEAKLENFRWTRGEEELAEYVASNHTTRQFCRICGSSMTFTPSHGAGGLIEFSLATLDCDIRERPDAHVFVDFKADWSMICDDLPQYREGRDSPRS
jgi:hypothetical protein